MINIRLIVVLKERLKTTLSLALSLTMSLAMFLSMIFTLSVFSPSILAETGTIPSKGMTQDQVKANFGEPLSIKPAVGKPPITRWDYQGYSVYFESIYVIHSFYQKQQLNIQAKQTQPISTPDVGKVETIPAPSANKTAIEEAPQVQAEENIKAEEVPVEIENTVEEIPEAVFEEVKVEEIPEAVVEEAMVEEIPEAIVEEVKVEEIKIEEVGTEKITEETKKDLNFEEPEKPADYDKWGY